jgi:hypothetical protein
MQAARAASQHSSMTFNTGIENISRKKKLSVMTSISMPSATSREDKTSSDIEAQAPQDAEVPASEPTQPPDQPPHTILTEKEKIFTIIMASFAAFISPVSLASTIQLLTIWHKISMSQSAQSI